RRYRRRAGRRRRCLCLSPDVPAAVRRPARAGDDAGNGLRPMTAADPAIRVILVDDEEDFRAPIASFLRKHGMTVEGVGSVEDLLPLLPEFRPDNIVLD